MGRLGGGSGRRGLSGQSGPIRCLHYLHSVYSVHLCPFGCRIARALLLAPPSFLDQLKIAEIKRGLID
jgi:hypothetical protein